jgi:hypothetical protein
MADAKHRKKQDDKSHCDLSNSFIDTFNQAAAAGYDVEFVASAATGAAAGYAGFSISGPPTPITDTDLDYMAAVYRYRMLKFMQDLCPEALSKELRDTPSVEPTPPRHRVKIILFSSI